MCLWLHVQSVCLGLMHMTMCACAPGVACGYDTRVRCEHVLCRVAVVLALPPVPLRRVCHVFACPRVGLTRPLPAGGG